MAVTYALDSVYELGGNRTRGLCYADHKNDTIVYHLFSFHSTEKPGIRGKAKLKDNEIRNARRRKKLSAHYGSDEQMENILITYFSFTF